MPIVEWDDSFKLGVTQFDEHHKYLFGLLTKLFNDFMFGANHEALEAVLSELVLYATFHFSAEERWMKAQGCPGVSQHRHEHDGFISRAAEIQNDFQNGKMNLCLDVMPFLKNWLINHILKIHAEYGSCVKGASSEACQS